MSRDAVEILQRAKRLVVVGASATPGKDAHSVTQYLVEAGYDVVPVNPNAREVLGRPTFATLADVSGPIDLVVVFRPSPEAPGVVEQAVRAGAGAVWLQSGIMHPEARAIAERAGIGYVENACTRTVHNLYVT